MHPYLEKEIEIHVDICRSILNQDNLSPKELMRLNLERIIILIGHCQELEKMIKEPEIIEKPKEVTEEDGSSEE